REAGRLIQPHPPPLPPARPRGKRQGNWTREPLVPLPPPREGGGGGGGKRGGVGAMANEIARSLRKRMTRQEVKLWVHLRSWRELGFHFRRQAPRASHIVDFVCLKERLIVEIDGGQHNFDTHAQRDAERDQYFAS